MHAIIAEHLEIQYAFKYSEHFLLIYSYEYLDHLQNY